MRFNSVALSDFVFGKFVYDRIAISYSNAAASVITKLKLFDEIRSAFISSEAISFCPTFEKQALLLSYDLEALSAWPKCYEHRAQISENPPAKEKSVVSALCCTIESDVFLNTRAPSI